MRDAAVRAGMASAGRKLGRTMTGRTSSADPTRTATSAAGSVLSGEIAKQLGVPGAAGFIRGILGGLLR